MTKNPDGGEYCPLCEVNQHIPADEEAKAECECPGGFKDIATCWIEGCTDAERDDCVERGLISESN